MGGIIFPRRTNEETKAQGGYKHTQDHEAGKWPRQHLTRESEFGTQQHCGARPPWGRGEESETAMFRCYSWFPVMGKLFSFLALNFF